MVIPESRAKRLLTLPKRLLAEKEGSPVRRRFRALCRVGEFDLFEAVRGQNGQVEERDLAVQHSDKFPVIDVVEVDQQAMYFGMVIEYQ